MSNSAGAAYEERMIRYLLGQMREPERDSFEEEYFADGELFARMKGCEEWLIEQYLEGRLPADQSRQFEIHFASSPRGQKKLMLTRSLMKRADRESSAQVAPQAIKPSLFRRRTGVAFWLPAVAMLTLAAACGWLIIQNARLSNMVERLRTEEEVARSRESESIDRAQAESQKSELLAAALEEERARNEQLQRDIAERVQPEQPPAGVASFLLIPNNLRAINEPQVIELAAATKVVRLELRLEPDDYTAYRAELQTVDNQPVWKKENLKATQGSRRKALFLNIPAERLKSQDYSLVIKGVTVNREIEAAAQYSFKVSIK